MSHFYLPQAKTVINLSDMSTEFKTCINHPDRGTSYQCQKYGVYLCQDCLSCKDPDLYCKNRQACAIWFIHKENKREQRQNK